MRYKNHPGQPLERRRPACPSPFSAAWDRHSCLPTVRPPPCAACQPCRRNHLGHFLGHSRPGSLIATHNRSPATQFPTPWRSCANGVVHFCPPSLQPMSQNGLKCLPMSHLRHPRSAGVPPARLCFSDVGKHSCLPFLCSNSFPRGASRWLPAISHRNHVLHRQPNQWFFFSQRSFVSLVATRVATTTCTQPSVARGKTKEPPKPEIGGCGSFSR
jgi:hypothetical protein